MSARTCCTRGMSSAHPLSGRLKGYRTILSRWCGVEARALGFERSHASLRIFIGDPDADHCEVICGDPLLIQMQGSWIANAPNVALVDDGSQYGLTLFTDIAAGVSILCHGVEVKERVQGG